MITHSDEMFGREAMLGQVIAHTPIIKPDGCTPGYVVVRETDREYAVHNVSVDEAGAYVGRYWGRYFDKNEPGALRRAMRAFVEKVMRWHDLHDGGERYSGVGPPSSDDGSIAVAAPSNS